jgi:protein-S-isoprenylcysteine O-methyltransferase Ste14
MNGLLPRALFAFATLPGTVAFLIPLLLIAPSGLRPFSHPVALLPLLIGVCVLLWCVREFYVAGRGTLAPWSPPQRLVTSGPYRWPRNPMYAGVLLILAGWAIGFASSWLTVYAIGMAIAFHVRVLVYEQPRLASRQPVEWQAYHRSVARWVGRPSSHGSGESRCAF